MRILSSASLIIVVAQMHSLLLLVFGILKVFVVLMESLQDLIQKSRHALNILVTSCLLGILGVCLFWISVGEDFDSKDVSVALILVASILFLVYAGAAVIVAFYSLYMVRKILLDYSLEKTKSLEKSDLNDANKDIIAKQLACATKLMYIIIVSAVIVVLLIGLALAIVIGLTLGHLFFLAYLSFVALLLTVLTFLLFFFYEESKALALMKQVKKQDTTNLHDIDAMKPLKPLQPLVRKLSDRPSLETRVHEKSTIIIPKRGI